MRTSRISRDTTKAAAASLARGARPLRETQARVLRQFAFDSGTAGREEAVTDEAQPSMVDADDRSETSSLSSVPEDLVPEDARVATSTRKRKRGAAGSPSPTSLGSAMTRSSKVSRTLPLHSPLSTSASTTTAATDPDPTIVAATAPKKVRRAPAKKSAASNESTRVSPPPHWEEVYNLTREMRANMPAPVDTMGCETLADRSRSPRDQRFQTLISLMLSSQTKDAVTAAAMRNLQTQLPGGLSLESVRAASPTTIDACIGKVGFHNNKTTYIKRTAELLATRWGGDIPDTIAGLTSLPGVGPKMAYLCMSAAWGRDEGIGVDVHVHRITNLWGWHRTRTPEQTRAALESWLPREKWHEINTLLVGFGQVLCTPVGRRCGECRLAERGLCPGAVVGRKRKVVVKREEGVEMVKAEEENVLAEEVAEGRVKAELLETQREVPDIEDVVGRRARRGRGSGD